MFLVWLLGVVFYASILAMVIGPLLYIAITAAVRGRYYEPARASVKHGVDR